MKRVLTLAFLLTDTRICLGLKKRGFGEGNWNGYGGKIEEGETIEEAAIREIQEESEVTVLKEDLEKVAVNEFFFTDGKHLEVHVYFVRTWIGEPTETEEMKPEWFAYDLIPFMSMWADDIHWLPRVLSGEKLLGKVWFTEDGKTIEQMEWNSVSAL